MEEDLRELFVDLREVSIGRLPQNGVKYFEPWCKQQLDFFRIHGGERGRGVDSKAEAITQERGISQDHVE